jgi:hypothetical protein
LFEVHYILVILYWQQLNIYCIFINYHEDHVLQFRYRAAPWLRQLVTSFSLWRPSLAPRPAYVWFIMDKGFSQSTLGLPSHFHSSNAPYPFTPLLLIPHNLSNWQHCSIIHSLLYSQFHITLATGSIVQLYISKKNCRLHLETTIWGYNIQLHVHVQVVMIWNFSPETNCPVTNMISHSTSRQVLQQYP